MPNNNKNFVAFAGILDSLDATTQTAEFLLMADGVGNRNRQGLSPKDMEKAFHQGLPVAPICINSDYQPGHNKPFLMPVAKWIPRANGKFYEKKDGYAVGTASINDQLVIEKLERGELGPISWNMLYSHQQCSQCKETLPDTGYKNHSHIKNGSAYAQLQNPRLISFDFVSVPAYPQAGFKQFTAASADGSSGEIHGDKAQFLLACAGDFERSQTNVRDEKTMSENKDETSARLTNLETVLNKNTQALETLTKVVEGFGATKTVVETIQKNMDLQAQQEHAKLVAAAYQKRVAAGLAEEETKEMAMLTKRSKAELENNIADADKIINKQTPPANPNPPSPANNLGQAGTPPDLNKLVEEYAKKNGY